MTSDTNRLKETEQDQGRFRNALGRWLDCEGEIVPQRKSWPESLQRVHAYGLVVIFAGFLGLATWSSFLARRFSLTFDYSFYAHAWFLIAHGHLNPGTPTVPSGLFLHNAFELIMWPLALLWYVWPHAVTLLWVQDAATAGCEAIVFVWMCEVTARLTKNADRGPWSILFPLSGLVLLVANPWTIWIDSFDFHPEAIALFFALVAAHAFWRGHARRAWIATLLTLACGAIGATYVAGLGLSAMLAGRKWRRSGLLLLGLGVLWLLMISHLGGDEASGVYSNLLKGSHLSSVTAWSLVKILFEHPSRAISAIWSVRQDVVADIAGGGFIGFFSPWAFGVSFLVLLEGSLTGSAGFIQPYVQNSLPLILLIPLGTVVICVTLAAARQKWKQITAFVLALLSVVNVLGWTQTWLHRTESQWVSVPATTASALNRTLSMIHPNDEVIASQGIEGRFSLRQWIYALTGGPAADFPIHSRTVWFVIAPINGIETEYSTAAESQIGQVADQLHARLISDSYGVYVFKWKPGPRRTSVKFTNVVSVPTWTLNSFPSTTVVTGPANRWHVQSNKSSEFIIWGDFWRLHDGRYTASVRLATYGTVAAELLNLTTGAVFPRKLFLPQQESSRQERSLER